MTDWFRSTTGRVFILLLFVCGGGLASMARPSFANRLDLPIYDGWQAIANPPEVEQKIVVVIATEASMKMFRQWPWPRGIHAGLLDNLALAKNVVFDVLFPEKSDPEQDSLFAKAVEKAGNVILAVHVVPDDRIDKSRLLLPYRELADVAADFGVVNVKAEPDGVYRDSYLFWNYNDELHPSLPFAVWNAIRGVEPEIEKTPGGYVLNLPTGPLLLDADNSFRIHHTDITTYEYADAYFGRVDPEAFRDAVVFVGVNTAGAADFFPVGGGKLISGVAYNAHALHTLLHGWIPIDGPGWMMGVAGAVLAAAGAVAGMRGKAWRGWRLALAALALWLAAGLWLFLAYRLWLPPTIPALVCIASYFLVSLVHLRTLSATWLVQSLSIESLLFANRQDIDVERLPFSRYLEDNWQKIHEWSGLELLRPDAGPDDPEVRDCLEKAAARTKDRSGEFGALAAVLSGRGGNNRLLVRLPAWEDGEQRFAVLGWRGSKSRETLRSIAALVISAAVNYQAVRETRAKRDLFFGVIRLVMRAVDAKDPFTAGHSERVAELSKTLAERMGLPRKKVDDIYLSGLLHDVGKIGIPDAILCKPGRLTDEEMEAMRSHPAMGEEMLGEITLPEAVMKGIVEHHERLDGKGYPRGLKGESLSLPGRILKITDVYDALVSKRQYKDPFPTELAYRILSEGAGTEFDAEIVSMILEQPFPLEVTQKISPAT